MVRVEQDQNPLSGPFSVVAFECLHIDAYRVSLPQACRKLHFTVDEIIVLDESADESDDDYWRHRVGSVRYRLCKAGLSQRNDGTKGQNRSPNQDTESTQCGRVDHLGPTSSWHGSTITVQSGPQLVARASRTSTGPEQPARPAIESCLFASQLGRRDRNNSQEDWRAVLLR